MMRSLKHNGGKAGRCRRLLYIRFQIYLIEAKVTCEIRVAGTPVKTVSVQYHFNC